MAQEAKFKLIDLHDSNNDNSIGFIEYKVKLYDADGVEVMYNITDYYNESNEIVDTFDDYELKVIGSNRFNK